MKYALFLVIMDMDKHRAAAELFGPNAYIKLTCDVDHAPETWGN